MPQFVPAKPVIIWTDGALPVCAKHGWQGWQNRRWCDHGKILWFRDVLQHFIGIYKNISAVDNPLKAIITEATTIYLWIFQDSMLLLFLTSLRQALLHVATPKFLGGKAGRSHLYVYNSSVKTVMKAFHSSTLLVILPVILSGLSWCRFHHLEEQNFFLIFWEWQTVCGMVTSHQSWAASSYTGGKVGRASTEWLGYSTIRAKMSKNGV